MKRRTLLKGLILSLLPNSVFANKKGERSMKKALILVDFQNDYFEGGTMTLNGITEALKNANLLIKEAKKNNWKIYTIQHFSTRKGATFFLPNTKGVELHNDLDTKDTTIIKKNYPNSFRDTILKDELNQKNISELIICGAMTHMCIDTTVRAGFDLGYKITLAHDACATKDLQFKGKTIKAQDVHFSFVSALANVFCEVKETEQIINI
jgi:nicotinamidase-related amidase